MLTVTMLYIRVVTLCPSQILTESPEAQSIRSLHAIIKLLLMLHQEQQSELTRRSFCNFEFGLKSSVQRLIDEHATCHTQNGSNNIAGV